MVHVASSLRPCNSKWRKQGTELAIGYLGVKKKCHYYVLKGRYVHVIVVSWLSRVYGICTLYVRTVGGYLWFMRLPHCKYHYSFVCLLACLFLPS